MATERDSGGSTTGAPGDDADPDRPTTDEDDEGSVGDEIDDRDNVVIEADDSDDVEIDAGNAGDVEIDETAVLAVFSDAAPRTRPEVAEETGLERTVVAATLDALVERSALRRKRVTGVDVSERSTPMATGTDAPAVDLWYLPEDRLEGGDVVVTLDDERAVEETLDELDVPGASELMRDWRRDAVRAAYEYVRERGPATADELREAVYPSHSAGYASRDDWWDCVEPRLQELPGAEERGGAWIVD